MTVRFEITPSVAKLLNSEQQGELEQAWETEQRRMREQDAMRQRLRLLEVAGAVGLTDDMEHEVVCGGRDLKPTPALKHAQQWLRAPKRPWLLLSGGSGSGKSVAAAWFVAEYGALWIGADQLVRLFAANFGEQYDEYQRVRSCRALVLDDIGTEKGDHKHMLGALIELIDSRKSSRTRTIITTNLTSKAFCALYANERLISRLHESVQFSGCGSLDLRQAKSTLPQSEPPRGKP